MCDHQSAPWCHQLPSGQQIQISVCVNCRPQETPEHCEDRYEEELAQAQIDYRANCP